MDETCATCKERYCGWSDGSGDWCADWSRRACPDCGSRETYHDHANRTRCYHCNRLDGES